MSGGRHPSTGTGARPADEARVARTVRAWLEDGVATLPEGMELPGAVRHHLIDQLTTTPQRRRWWSDRWPTRGRRVLRSDGVPGDSVERRTRRMFGFAALLAAGALAGAGLLATMQQDAGPRTIVVAQDGSGDVTTIGEGVALAVDGDTVLIRPGTYHEQVTVTEAITIAGDGARETVVWEGLAAPKGTIDPFAVLLDHTTATLTNVTLNGMPSTLRIAGGSPLVEGIAMVGTGVPYGSSDPCTDERGCGVTMSMTDATTATIRGNTFTGGADIVVDGDSDPLIEGNVLSDGPHFYLADPGDAAALRNNAISDTYDRGIGIFAPSTMLIEGNTITDPGGDGITVGWNFSPGVDPVIRGNTISLPADRVTSTGVNVQPQAKPTLEANAITGGQFGIWLTSSDAIVRGNTLDGMAAVGIAASMGGAPQIEGNSIHGAMAAFSIDSAVEAALTGNELCGNALDYRLGGKEAALPPGNTVCEAGGSPSAAP